MQAGDLLALQQAGVLQPATGQILEAVNVKAGAGQQVAAATGGGVTLTQAGQFLQQPQTQVIATPVTGPGGTVQYVINQQQPAVQPQQLQSVTIQGPDGQEQTVLVPASPAVPTMQNFIQGSTQTQMPAFVTPTGQIIQTQPQQPAQALSTIGGIPIANAVGTGGVVNLGQVQGIQNVAVRQGNVMQAVQVQAPAALQTIPVQIPVSTANGQTVYQTIQLPIQNVQGSIQSPTGFNIAANASAVQAANVVNLVPQQGSNTDITNSGSAVSTQAAASQQTVTVASNHSKIIAVPAASTSQPAATPTILNVPSLGSIGSSFQAVIPSSAVASASVTTANSVTVASLPQTVASPSVAPASGVINAQALQNIQGKQTVQNVMLSNGQIVQTISGQTLQNVQILGQNGQLIQAPIISAPPVAGSGTTRPVVQPIQVQNVQSLQNVQNLSAVQGVSTGLQVAQTQAAQIVGGTTVLSGAGAVPLLAQQQGGQVQLVQAMAAPQAGTVVSAQPQAVGSVVAGQIISKLIQFDSLQPIRKYTMIMMIEYSKTYLYNYGTMPLACIH